MSPEDTPENVDYSVEGLREVGVLLFVHLATCAVQIIARAGASQCDVSSADSETPEYESLPASPKRLDPSFLVLTIVRPARLISPKATDPVTTR
jgi:hypothetical protein